MRPSLPIRFGALCWITFGTMIPTMNGFAAEPFRYPAARHKRGELFYHQHLPVLIVRGTHAEMGEQIGALALKPAAKAIELVEGFAARQIPARLRLVANAAMAGMYAQFPPEYQQEVTAMSTASGVPVQSLILANTLIDLQEIVGCSSILVAASQSATGAPLYGRNMDLPYVEGLAEYSLLIVYVPTGGYAFAMPSLPGFLMLASGMNEHGLALGSQSVGTPNDGSARFRATGTASAVAGRRLMETCDNVRAVGVWLEKNRLARPVSIAACDLERQTVFEVTTARVLSRQSDTGVCCATNHFRAPELAAGTECPRFAILDGIDRKMPLDLVSIHRALHAAHQENMTVHTMIFEPQARRMHLAMGPGPATALPLTRIDLSELFGRN